MPKITLQVPGKLYLAGEYAVTHPYHSAVIAAISAFLHLSLTPSTDGIGHLVTNQSPFPLDWTVDETGRVQGLPDPFVLIASCLETSYRYLLTHGPALLPRPYVLTIQSDLDSPSGAKYGLGSSAAVSVACIEALLQAYHVPYTPRLIYQLAVISQKRIGLSGSFGDIACTSFRTLIAYQNFDPTLLNQALTTSYQLEDLLDPSYWPGLDIQPLPWPTDWEMAIAWTKSPSSTDDLLQLNNAGHLNSTGHFEQRQVLTTEDFLQASQSQVNALQTALNQSNWDKAQAALTANGTSLLRYHHNRSVPYQTPALKQAVTLAQYCQAASKISGAGGGDCAIALCPNPSIAQEVRTRWQTAGLSPLPFSLVMS